MKIKFVYGLLPVIVFYTSKLIPKWAGGLSLGPILLIKPKYKESKSLLGHELVHSKQVYRYLPLWLVLLISMPWYITIASLGLPGLLYHYVRSYRLKMELEAYLVQVKERKYSEYIIKWVSKSLYNHYNLGYGKEDLEDMVFEYYEKEKIK